MIAANSIIDLARVLERKMGDVEIKDQESWTLEECHAIQDALTSLGSKASILFIACMTEEEMAEIEKESMGYEEGDGDELG